jgi:hypothetical protein
MLDADSPQNAAANGVRNLAVPLLFVVFLLISSALAAQPGWKTFVNRAGWSMNYPADWTIASCHSCSDPTAPEVYVDFFPPKNKRASGFVIVEPLAEQPPRTTIDEWFADVKSTANQNPRVAEKRFTLNALPALRVRYRNAGDGGYEMETVYVVSRGRTFAIAFSTERRGVSLEATENYSTYVQMVKTFKIKR